MRYKIFRTGLLLIGIWWLQACANTVTAKDGSDDDWIVCNDPRPEMCAMIYQPVCGRKKNYIECFKAPCDERFDYFDYASACSACSDPAVQAYRDGTCKPE